MFRYLAVVALVLAGSWPVPAEGGWRHDRRADKRWHRRHPGFWWQPPPPWVAPPPRPVPPLPPPVRPVPPLPPPWWW